MIGFVGRPATQEGMRPPLVVPFDEASQPGPEIPAAQWHVKQSCVLVLRCVILMPFQNASIVTSPRISRLSCFRVADWSGNRYAPCSAFFSILIVPLRMRS